MLVSFGTNLFVSQPDVDLARKALAALDFHVHADFFVNATAREADIVLPVSTSWEREGLRTGFDASLDGLRHVQLRPAVIARIGETRSDTDIVLGLSKRLGLAGAMFDLDTDRGHDVVLAGAGITIADLREKPEGLDVPTSIVLEPFAVETDGIPRGFPTPTRRIEIYSERLHRIGQAPVPTLDQEDLAGGSPRYPLVLGCAKTIAFCHSQHRNIASLRRLMPDPQLEMSSADATARGIAHGDWVTIETAAGKSVARAAIVDKMIPGTVFGQHGWWAPGGDDTPYAATKPLAANINAAVGTERQDPISGSIPLRAYPCEVRRHAG
jgi:anaerobic selenocysteine-containing dehydrogenase